MQKNIFIYILCAFVFSASNNFIVHEGQLIEENTIIVKFSNTYAPLLGQDQPLTIESIDEFEAIQNRSSFKSLQPLFKHIENFTELHYEYDLHQYYKLTLNNNINVFNQVIVDLKSIDIIDNIELNGVAEALLVPNDSLYSNQWDHDNRRQAIQYGTGDLVGTADCDLDTDAAWDITTGNPDVVILLEQAKASSASRSRPASQS